MKSGQRTIRWVEAAARRRAWWVAGGVVAGLVIVAGLLWSARDPWPARVVVRPGWPWSAAGYSADARSYRTSNEAGVSSWDVATGRRIEWTPDLPVWRLGTSPDGRRFAGWVGADFGADAEVVEGDAATGTIEHRFPVPGSRGGWRVSFGDGGRSVVAVLADRGRAMTVATWDLATGAESRRAVTGPGGGCYGPVAIAPDGRTWAYDDRAGDGVRLWDAAADRPIGGLLRDPAARRAPSPHLGAAAAFSPDGRTLVADAGDGRVEAWDVPSGRLVRALPLHTAGRTVSHLRFAPDGRTLVSTAQDYAMTPIRRIGRSLLAFLLPAAAARSGAEVVAADLAAGEILARSPGSQAVDLSPDGRTVVTAEPDRSLSFRDLPRPARP